MPAPEKEGYTFSGWEGLPEVMPAKDVTVSGSFTVNSYKLTYVVDGEVYLEETVSYGKARLLRRPRLRRRATHSAAGRACPK